MDIRKGDVVKIITGIDKGKEGRVLRIFPKKNKVIVEGTNYIWKHVRPSQTNPKGGRVKKERTVSISNVALLCGNCDKAAKVKKEIREGKKVRVCKKCGESIIYKSV